jgi:hypothetical protein
MTKTNAKPKTWAQHYGAKRQAIDRAILAELEQAIAAEERAATPNDGMRKSYRPRFWPTCLANSENRPGARPGGCGRTFRPPHNGNDRQGNDRRYDP